MSTWISCGVGAVADDATTATDVQGPDEPGTRGSLDVRQRVLTRMAEHTATLVPGSVTHTSTLGKIAGRGYPSASATISGRTSRIELDVAAVWPCDLDQLARTVRDRVKSETGRLSGTRVNSVDVTVHLVDKSDAATSRRVE